MTPLPTTAPPPPGVQRVVYDEQLLDASWRWFTTTDLGTLTDTPPFTREQQRAWFDGLPDRTDYISWGVAVDGAPVGAFGLKHVTDHDGEYWAYLAEPASRGRGIGQWMFKVVCDEGRRRGLTHLTGVVLKTNERALRVDLALGFYIVGEDDERTYIVYDL